MIFLYKFIHLLKLGIIKNRRKLYIDCTFFVVICTLYFITKQKNALKFRYFKLTSYFVVQSILWTFTRSDMFNSK